jgi:hypothetical protein
MPRRYSPTIRSWNGRSISALRERLEGVLGSAADVS